MTSGSAESRRPSDCRLSRKGTESVSADRAVKQNRINCRMYGRETSSETATTAIKNFLRLHQNTPVKADRIGPGLGYASKNLIRHCNYKINPHSVRAAGKRFFLAYSSSGQAAEFPGNIVSPALRNKRNGSPKGTTRFRSTLFETDQKSISSRLLMSNWNLM